MIPELFILNSAVDFVGLASSTDDSEDTFLKFRLRVLGFNLVEPGIGWISGFRVDGIDPSIRVYLGLMG